MNYLFLNKKVLACATLFLVGLSSNSLAQTPETIEKVKSKITGERLEARAEILKERTALIQRLESIASQSLENESEQEVAGEAILLLGKMRSVESVSFLINHMSFEVFPDFVLALPNFASKYPVVEALIEIGNPSISPLLTYVSRKGDPEKIDRAAAVLKGVYGEQIAKICVELRIEESRSNEDSMAVSNLEKILPALRDSSKPK